MTTLSATLAPPTAQINSYRAPHRWFKYLTLLADSFSTKWVRKSKSSQRLTRVDSTRLSTLRQRRHRFKPPSVDTGDDGCPTPVAPRRLPICDAPSSHPPSLHVSPFHSLRIGFNAFSESSRCCSRQQSNILGREGDVWMTRKPFVLFRSLWALNMYR